MPHDLKVFLIGGLVCVVLENAAYLWLHYRKKIAAKLADLKAAGKLIAK